MQAIHLSSILRIATLLNHFIFTTTMKKILLLTLLPYLTLAQPTTTHQITVKPNTSYLLKFPKAFQAISITYHSEQSLAKATVIADNQAFLLEKNVHTHYQSQQHSQLLVFEKPIQSFRLESGQLNGKIEIHLYHLVTVKK